MECGGLTPLCYRKSMIKAKAVSGRRTPKWMRLCAFDGNSIQFLDSSAFDMIGA